MLNSSLSPLKIKGKKTCRENVLTHMNMYLLTWALADTCNKKNAT